jgi:nanoRNase/pAp phosphatase (c-di-AMP/oligoRNAs hydrolase)
VNQDLTPKQQTSEAIRQAETILIITGQHPSIDQVASTMALAAVLRKFGKKVTALISDTLPQQVSFLETNELDRNLSGLRDFILKVDIKKAQVDKLRYEVQEDKLKIFVTPFKGTFAPSDVTYDYGSYRYDLVIVLGVPTRARIDRVYADNPALFENLPIVNLDFHRSNEQYGAINLIEPMASSLAEILVALAESLQNGIVDEQIATAMLTGLMASTDRFTASHTTAKSLTVAAQLMAAGAKQPNIVRALFRSERNDRNERTVQQPRPQVQAAPTPTPTPAPIVEVLSAPEPEFHGPIAAEPSPEPIIDPSHVELMEGMADFSAAAEILQQPRD